MSPPAETLHCPQCQAEYTAKQQYCGACGFPVGTLGESTGDKFIGKSLPGGYHILDLISIGGMGRVYRAEQSVLGRTVAVKVIHPHLLADDSSAVRFMTEARAASQLNHPNSIAVYDFGRTSDGQPYIVMEYLRGKDLARVAWEEGPLPIRRIADVLRQVLAAVAEAHELGIIHRDLKPENIILEPLRRGGDLVKVLDFGLAKLRADAQGPSVTSPGIVCGTPDYMAPEQGRGDPIDGRSDLYSVGVILFQLLTGRLPFEAESPTQVVMMHLSIPPPDPRHVAPQREIPTPLVDVLTRALAKDPAQRFQDAEEFSDALTVAVDGEASPAAGKAAPVPSLVAGVFVACGACKSSVPKARFCCECGAALLKTTDSALLSRSSILGRDEEVAWLLDRLSATGDRFAGARVVGEAGAGKTRLLDEFLRIAEEDGARVIRVRPDPWWANVGGHGLKGLLRQISELSDGALLKLREPGMPEAAERGIVDTVETRSSLSDGRTPERRAEDAVAAIRWALAHFGAARGKRLVVAADDLQRADGVTRNALTALLRQPGDDLRGLLIATHPPGFDPRWPERVAVRTLGGLPPPAVSRMLSDAGVGGMYRTLEDTGRGVLPLYVEQVIRYTREAGTDPPARLADLLARRIDLLDPKARKVLQTVAVLGDAVALELLGKTCALPEDCAAAVDSLSNAGMIRRDDERVTMTHPLLHELVLATTPAEVRRDLHRRALETLQGVAAPIEARAIHAYGAQDTMQALFLLEQVAQRARSRADGDMEVLALHRALDLARQELSRGELDDPLQAVLIFGRKLGGALRRAGNVGDAEGVLREALDVAGPSGSDRARVLAELAGLARDRGRPDEAKAYHEQALRTARETGNLDLADRIARELRG